jgi:hypothetical protein
MTKTAIVLIPVLFAIMATAQTKKKPQQEIKVPLTAENWSFKPGTVEFITHRSVPAMKILNGPDTAVLKDLDFTDGTIEYDIELLDQKFTAFYFRRSSQKETECFYFRPIKSGKGDAVQYAPFIDGVNLWDMLFHYQARATFEQGKWNHVKLVISGKQMRAYVNNDKWPCLLVPRLEGNSLHGAISFDGQVIISNLTVKPGQTGNLSPEEAPDLTDHDTRYIRRWLISPAVAAPKRFEFNDEYLKKKDSTRWDTIWAERRGLVNVTRKYGGPPYLSRRLVWLKTDVHSAIAQTRQLNLGISDEVWVYANGKFIGADQNFYGHPLMKQPQGRTAVENTSMQVPLQEGNNEIMIALACDFYGWGIIAQWDKDEDLTLNK